MRGRIVWSAIGLLLCLQFVACGGGSNPAAPTPTPTPTPAPVTDTLLQGGVPNMEVLVLYTAGAFTTTVTGRLEVTVDWTFATDNLDVYVARGTCTVDQVNQRTCSLAGVSESTTAKPERITVSGLAPGTYSFMIGNRGPAVESASYQVTLTH